MKKKPIIYFLGSGDIAIPSLAALARSRDIQLAGVGTQPDRPAGRKKIPQPTPVAQWCLDNGIPCDRLGSVNSAESVDKLKCMAPDILLVICFGQILKKEVLDIPSCACVNVHASLLPSYRGASPVNAAILNGDTESGVTFMRMDEGLDTGPVYKRCHWRLSGNETAFELEARLGELAAENLEDVLPAVVSGALKAEAQNDSEASIAPKIRKQDGAVSWEEPAEIIERKIRAYNPWPGAVFFLDTPKRKIRIKINEAQVAKEDRGVSGEVLEAGRDGLLVRCGKNALRLQQIVPEGKKEMSSEEFLRGTPVQAGTLLEKI